MAAASNPPTDLCADDRDRALTVLLHAVRNGCPTSFQTLYERTSPRLFGLVLRIIPDRAEAEDVLQEVYVNAWTRCVQFDADKGCAMNWLVGIARYSAIDSLRRRGTGRLRVHFSPIDEDDAYAGLPSSDLQPLDGVIFARRAAAVREGLRGLSNEQRECLMLAYCDGLSHTEIADRLGRPVGTVKSWVRRALLSMRPALAAHR